MRGIVGPKGSPPVRAALVGAASAVAISAAAGAVVMGAGKRFSFVPTVTAQPTPWNRDVLALCPKLFSPYHLSPFLRNGHVETIFAAWFRRDPRLAYSRELVRMPDGGTVALDTEGGGDRSSDLPKDAPVLILLPGLTGGSDDTYVQHAVLHAKEAGIRAVVFNSRGTSESPVTTPQFYSASFTQDLRHVVGHVAAKYPGAPLFAAGWSLGANILTRYLGEEGSATPLTAAIAMCNPFNLPLSDANFKRGFNKIYDWNLARSLRKIYAKHRSLFEEAARSGVRGNFNTLVLFLVFFVVVVFLFINTALKIVMVL